MELAPPRRHWKRELLVTFAVVTVLVILYANPHELRNTIGGTGLYPGRRGSRGKDGASNNSSGGNGSPFPIRALGRFRHESNGTSGTDWESEEVVRVLLIFTRARELRYLREKLSICLGSLIELSSVPLRLYVVTDGQSADVALQVLADASAKASADVSVSAIGGDREAAAMRPRSNRISPVSPPCAHHPARPLSCGDPRNRACCPPPACLTTPLAPASLTCGGKKYVHRAIRGPALGASGGPS